MSDAGQQPTTTWWVEDVNNDSLQGQEYFKVMELLARQMKKGVKRGMLVPQSCKLLKGCVFLPWQSAS